MDSAIINYFECFLLFFRDESDLPQNRRNQAEIITPIHPNNCNMTLDVAKTENNQRSTANFLDNADILPQVTLSGNRGKFP